MSSKDPVAGGQTLRTDPFFLGGMLVLVVLGVLYLIPSLDPNDITAGMDRYGTFLLVSLGMAAPWIGLPPMKNGRERAFWLLWTVGLGFFFLVRAVYVWDPLAEERSGAAFLIDFFYVLFYLALILSLQVRPDRPQWRKGRWPVHPLEAFGTAIFVGSLLAYFVIVPALMDPDDYLTFIPALTLFCILDAFILISLLHIRSHCRDRSWRIIYSWLSIVVAWWLIVDTLSLLHFAWVIDLWGGPWDILYYGPWMIIIIAARVRTVPRPDWMGFCIREDPHPLGDTVSRAGWMILAAFSLPLIHFFTESFGIIAPTTEFAREIVMIGFLSLIVGIGLIHEHLMEKQTLRLAEEKARAEEHTKLLAAAIEQSEDAILIGDDAGIVQYANAALRSSGLEPEQATGRPLSEVLGFLEATPGQKTLAECLVEGVPWEGRGVLGGGHDGDREETVTVFPVRDAHGRLTNSVAVGRDITYLSQLERQSRQTHKMEALGTLAGGIAHDFNNILASIMGNAELARQDLEPDSQARSDLAGLLKAANRAAALVNQILMFSRKGGDDSDILSLEEVAEEALELLRATLPSTIEIRRTFAPSERSIRGVRAQVHQIILNLGTNAAHAMGERGGVLEVGLREEEVGREGAGPLELPPGRYFLLSIRDTGKGMDQETMDRIFDPFFTTKGVGKGTGLGLAVVHGAVKAHGGSIAVESEVGKGTTFGVYLPSVPEKPSLAGDEGVPPPEGKGETVVVVDDEPGLVQLSQKILQGLGYRVIGFTDSIEALGFLAHASKDVHALVTDQTMPRLTGLELAKELKGRDSRVKILLTTGYSESVSPDRLAEAGIEGLLMKPFREEELGWAVRTLMD